MEDRKLDIKEVENKLELFYKEKTPTFLKITFGDGYHYHNGYIKEIKETYILFYDEEVGEFPIDIKEIVYINVSRRKNGKG